MAIRLTAKLILIAVLLSPVSALAQSAGETVHLGRIVNSAATPAGVGTGAAVEDQKDSKIPPANKLFEDMEKAFKSHSVATPPPGFDGSATARVGSSLGHRGYATAPLT